MRTTVLLPVYNAGPPLRSAIESILAQDYGDFEFLIIDDSSKDTSADVIREYAGLDRRIQAIYHSTNMGLAATLNEGLNRSRCEFVARMDQDDISLPHRIGTQCRFMNAHHEVAVSGSYVFHMGIDERSDRLVELPITHEEIVRTLVRENCLYHPSVIMRRRAVCKLGGYRSEFKNAEDYDLWLRVSRHYKIANIPEALIRYRFSIDGMTLGRKWEQLFYVYLAQAAHENHGQPFAVCEEVAKRRIEETDRSNFMQIVAKGTLDELIRLGYSQDIAAKALQDVLR